MLAKAVGSVLQAVRSSGTSRVSREPGGGVTGSNRCWESELEVATTPGDQSSGPNKSEEPATPGRWRGNGSNIIRQPMTNSFLWSHRFLDLTSEDPHPVKLPCPRLTTQVGHSKSAGVIA